METHLATRTIGVEDGKRGASGELLWSYMEWLGQRKTTHLKAIPCLRVSNHLGID